MKYEAPELTALTPAIDAIQTSAAKNSIFVQDNPTYEVLHAYADWED